MLSTAAYRAEKETEGDPADAIVWDELVARTREEGLSVTLLTSRQYDPHAGASGSVVSKGWISVSPPGPAAAETNPRTEDFVQQRPRADEATPSVSRSMVWSSTSLVMATALSRGHPPAAPGRPRRRGSPSVHRPQSPKRTIRINRAGGRRQVQQVSGCRRVRRQAEAR